MSSDRSSYSNRSHGEVYVIFDSAVLAFGVFCYLKARMLLKQVHMISTTCVLPNLSHTV
jgi:hypothetical protein